MTHRITKTYDDSLVLHEWGTALTADDYGSNALDTAIILDLGAGLVEGDIIIDVSQLDVDNGDESVCLSAQLSDSSTFSSVYYNTIGIKIGDQAVLVGDTDMTTGRYVLPFNNMIKDGTTLRYLRFHIDITGTIAGFLCKAYLAVRNRQ